MAQQSTVLITGCSEGGIGYYLALEFARQNYHVFATARRPSSMQKLSENKNITLVELDVTSKASIQNAYSFVSKATGGTLDILYHNAGVRSIVLGMHSDWELAEKTFQANLFSVVEMNRVFMPLVMKAGVGSKIVFSNSVAAVTPVPTTSIYNASKAALNMYAKVLHMELLPLGIHVVDVMTGEVGTTMAEQSMEKLPEGSPYSSIKSIIDHTWSVRKTIMPVEEYCQQVVKKVVQTLPPQRIWVGGNSTMVWLVETFGLQRIYPILFRREYGLDKLAPSKH